MPNKIDKDILSYQKPLITSLNEIINYGLQEDKQLFNNIMRVEMYNWLNENNCCSKLIQCNFSHTQETIQYLNNLKLNINTTRCC